MEKNLVIGEVIKPQGILGEIKVKPYTDDVSRFQSLKEVYVCGETYRVLNARIAQDAVYLSLSGVPDRNAAERLRGKFLEVKRENAAPLAEGRYYIVDVLGSSLLTETGEKLGVVCGSLHRDGGGRPHGGVSPFEGRAAFRRYREKGGRRLRKAVRRDRRL